MHPNYTRQTDENTTTFFTSFCKVGKSDPAIHTYSNKGLAYTSPTMIPSTLTQIGVTFGDAAFARAYLFGNCPRLD